LRSLALAGAAGALVAGMLPGAVPAGAAPGPVKSAAVARAEATGFAGLHGGHASGKAVGRSRVTRTAKPPVLTTAQRRAQRQAARMPVLAPRRVQGKPASRPAVPTSPQVAPAKRGSAVSPRSPSAPADFDRFRAQEVIPGDGQSSTNEPSVANDGSNVLYTGNWYAAQSSDSGRSFSFLDPYTLGPAPALPNGGFCCDQAVIHAPARGITAWALMYNCVADCESDPGTNNLIRLAVARNQADLAADTFDYYDFSAQTFGFPDGYWLDYPHLGVNANNLMLTLNVFRGTSFAESILIRFDLAPFTTGSWSANWVFSSQDFTWTPPDNSTDTWTYWAATARGNGSLIRVYNWPPATDFTHVSWNDFSVNFAYERKQEGSCPAPDGNNWCAFDDSRVKTGGEAGSGTVFFMWDAKQGGSFPYPYVEYASFDVSTGPATAMRQQSQIWNSNGAWAYPGLGVDARGDLGLSAQVGGGTLGYPSSQFLISDDITGGHWAAQFLDNSTHASNRWGDFLTARAATTGTSIGNTWIAAGFTLHDNGSGSATAVPGFYWLGRERDDPFAPTWAQNGTNLNTEGITANDTTGIFTGPSNCTCDYAASIQWGDGASSAPRPVGLHSQGLFQLSAPHAYAEEGTYTTTTNVIDAFGGTASGTGTVSVADAPLTAQGKTITGVAGAALAKTVAAFQDADPGGTASDYTATIHWGDGTASPGTIGGNFTVTGKHTYTATGTRAISTTITDTGGATVTATGHASIGKLPTVSSVSPASGTHTGGKSVTLTGAHFTGATSVKFGTASAHFTVKSDTKIVVTTPRHAAGTVDIRITAKYGTSKISSHDKYKFT